MANEERDGDSSEPDEDYRRRLYRILSDPTASTDAVLERLLDLGCEHLDVENGHVVSVDPDTDRHEVVAAAGSDVVQTGDRTDLGETFCRKTVTSEQLLVVEDAVADGWGDDPAVREWDIECYIGSRVLRRSELFGTVCFVDRNPREGSFSRSERAFVDLLSRSVSQVLERDHFEETLQERTELFELFVTEVSDYAIFLLDPAGQVAAWNAGAHNLKGYTEEEIVGEHFARFYTAADRERGLPAALLEEARRKGRAENEGWRVRKDGSRFWALVSITALRDDEGDLRGFGKVTRDLTERRAARRRLEDEQQFVERALNTLQDLFFVLDVDGSLERVNERVLEVTGHDEETLLSMEPRDLFDPDDGDRIDAAIAEVVETGEATVEATLWTGSGERRQYEFRARRLTDDDGAVTGIVGIGRDITAQQLYQERLDVAQRMLRHNLRNELTVISGWVEALTDTATPEQQEAVDRIEETTGELIDLTEKARLMAEMGPRLDRAPVTVDVSGIVGSVVERFRAGHPDAVIETDVPASLEVSLGAADRLEVAVANAVENAIEHNPGERPWMSVGVEHRDGVVSVAVEDEGPPIPETEQQVLDEGGEDPLRHGSGLGLWLIHWCMTTLGGDVSFETRAEGGNRITLWFPTADGEGD